MTAGTYWVILQVRLLMMPDVLIQTVTFVNEDVTCDEETACNPWRYR